MTTTGRFGRTETVLLFEEAPVATVPTIGRAVNQTAGIAAQPAEATRDLYERYGRQIFAYCVVQLRNREDAEDAVQTTFLNAFRGLERGIVPELESAWLYKIAQNVCLTRRRSWSRRRTVESPEDFGTVQELIGSPERDTGDLAELTDALRTLPEQQRRAILLREWQGLTYKEIAAEMQLSQAAVETLIFRARRSLAQAIERLRASGDMGSIFAALKSLLFGVGTKVAVTVVTVATTSVVAATPQARQNLIHFVDAVSNITAPTTKPRQARHAAVAPVHPAAAAAPAATAKPAAKTAATSPTERHAVLAHARLTKKSTIEPAAAVAVPAAAAAEPPAHEAKPSPAVMPATAPVRTVVPPAVTQPTDTVPTQTTATPAKASTSGSTGDGAKTTTTTTSTAVAPSLTGFSPSSGPAGTYVQVGGHNFTGATAVTFNGTSAPFSVSSDGQLTTKVPDGATSGPITIVTPNGRASSGDSFSVTASASASVPAPTISGTSPPSGPVGTSVGIGGHNFTGATAVRFNGTSADFTISSDGVIVTHVPPAATSGPVTVVTPNGTATSSGNFTVTAPAPPTVSGTSPAGGPAGASVAIGGKGFTGATAVRFNGTNADFTVSSDGQIATRVPAGATSGPITVVTPNGTGTSSGNFTVAVPAAPTVEGLSPASGPAGTYVQIGGHNFTGATGVRFNGISASFTVTSEGQITAQVPSSATSGPVSVTTPNGTGSSSGSFTVTGTIPEIGGFTPGSGAAGASVGIGGLHLTGATSVKFNGVSATFVVNSDTSISTTVPAGATSGTITVTTPSGTATSSGSFTVTH